MENVGPHGELQNDKVVQALLNQRNTPEPGCKLSPAQILLGRRLEDLKMLWHTIIHRSQVCGVTHGPKMKM